MRTVGAVGPVAVGVLDFSLVIYTRAAARFQTTWDIASGLAKAAVFGLAVALVGCYEGYTATVCARGVGRATTQAAVSAAILIFACDDLLTALISRLA